MYSQLARASGLVARLMAYVGGCVLLVLVVITCLSIIGRVLVPLGLAPIKGTFEWIEIGTGTVVFAFLPWCQLHRTHAVVDLLQPVFATWLNHSIELLADLGLCLATLVMTWRLYLGMLDKMYYTETTFILQFPVWQAYAAGLVGACAAVLVAAFCVLRAIRILLGLEKGTGDYVEY